MCASQSAFDCISWSRLIAYHSFAGLLGRDMSEAFISAYKRFTLFSFAFFVAVVVVAFFCAISQASQTLWISELWRGVT